MFRHWEIHDEDLDNLGEPVDPEVAEALLRQDVSMTPELGGNSITEDEDQSESEQAEEAENITEKDQAHLSKVRAWADRKISERHQRRQAEAA